MNWHLLILQSCTLAFKVPTYLPFDSWQCGPDDHTRRVTYDIMAGDCCDVMNDTNSCCINHDWCYDDQGGLIPCDTSFCHCITRTLSKADHKDSCEEKAAWACNVVELLGPLPYFLAGLGLRSKLERTRREISIGEKCIIEDKTVRRSFDILRDSCDEMSVTITTYSGTSVVVGKWFSIGLNEHFKCSLP
ncbi:hypothetical protein AB6A40_003137 [Gnathostoma spinigerum]|uniref:Phospholipase A2 n=1 Tax=Gnathostoma spinigerum TaxID=75299 RepID=A0ABD6E8S9_9BILA